MLGLLKKIYEENEYRVEELKEDILFSEKDGQEYFLTARYDENEITNFFECDKTVNVIKAFEDLKIEKNDIKKNTSLLVCIEVNNIEEFNKKYRNLIFTIEEDEYFFRKYVILYSNDSIKNIKSDGSVDDQIHEILLSDKRMEGFQENYFTDEEFFIAMQLIVKVPFLVFKSKTDKFKALMEKINDNITENKLTTINKSIQTFEESCIENDLDEYFEELESAFLSEESDEEILTSFLNHFDEVKS